MVAWRRGDFVGAAAGFRLAQSLVPHPATQFNVADAEERAGHVEEAVAAYEEYLRQAPNAPDAASVRRTVERLRESLRPPTPPEVVTPAVVVTPPEVAPPAVVVTPPEVTPPVVVTPPEVVPPAVVAPRPPANTYDRILDRRRRRLFSFRFGLIGGFAAPRDRQNFAVGGEATVFLWRSLTVLGHVLSIQTDGSPWVWTAEVGWTFVGDDFDLAALAHVGFLNRCDSVCRGRTGAVDDDSVLIAGVTLKVDVLFHPRFSAGLYGRFSWQELNLVDGDALLSSIGLSVSFHL